MEMKNIINKHSKGATMKKALFYLFLVAFIAVTNTAITYSQSDIIIKKHVVPSGGMVGVVSDNIKMSGAFGQTIIETRKYTESGIVQGTIVHQGFWVPEASLTSVEEPNFSFNSSISNYPNPVNSSTTFKYELESNAFVTLRVFDMVGNQVVVFQDVYQSQGMQTYLWNTRNNNGLELTSGSYIYELIVQPAERKRTSNYYQNYLRNVMVLYK